VPLAHQLVAALCAALVKDGLAVGAFAYARESHELMNLVIPLMLLSLPALLESQACMTFISFSISSRPYVREKSL
jgi:hypothetical protein